MHHAHIDSMRSLVELNQMCGGLVAVAITMVTDAMNVELRDTADLHRQLHWFVCDEYASSPCLIMLNRPSKRYIVLTPSNRNVSMRRDRLSVLHYAVITPT